MGLKVFGILPNPSSGANEKYLKLIEYLPNYNVPEQFRTENNEEEQVQEKHIDNDTIDLEKNNSMLQIEKIDLCNIQTAWDANNNKEHNASVIDPEVHGKNKDGSYILPASFVRRHDFVSLHPGMWMNDAIINAFLTVLNTVCKLKKLKIHIWQTHFFTKLYANKKCNYNEVERWHKNVDGSIFEKDIVIIPVNKDGVHWVVIAIYIVEKRIEYYDSMRANDDDAMAMMQCCNEYLKKLEEKKYGTSELSKNFELKIMDNLPQQLNGYDCGAFMLNFTYSIVMNFNQDFEQLYANYWRYFIGAVLLSPKKYLYDRIENESL